MIRLSYVYSTSGPAFARIIGSGKGKKTVRNLSVIATLTVLIGFALSL